MCIEPKQWRQPRGISTCLGISFRDSSPCLAIDWLWDLGLNFSMPSSLLYETKTVILTLQEHCEDLVK